jgi:hypothetical protein
MTSFERMATDLPTSAFLTFYRIRQHHEEVELRKYATYIYIYMKIDMKMRVKDKRRSRSVYDYHCDYEATSSWGFFL